MVHDTPTLLASSVRLILSVSAVLVFRIFSHDVNQAYVQSGDKLTRKKFLLPKEEDLETLGIRDDELLEVFHYTEYVILEIIKAPLLNTMLRMMLLCHRQQLILPSMSEHLMSRRGE